MARLIAVTFWLLAGATLTAGAYWGFLNTPESTVGTLVLSAVLALVSLVLVAIAVNGAVSIWSTGWSRATPRAAVAHAPAFLPPFLLAVLVWSLARVVQLWVTAHAGEINATFIARFGWADAWIFFSGVSWGLTWLGWVVGPAMALVLLSALIGSGWSSLAKPSSVLRALAPVRLALTTLWFAVFIGAPWRYLVPWRPRGLPATSVELAFIIAKLAVAAVLMAIGLALIIRQASQRQRT